jgi:uncharacterized membrane protein YozB (DUF420 family)
MLELTDFPALNAGLNATTGVLLLTGYACIRAKRKALHRAVMLAAFTTSVVFLACYLWYHAHAGSTRFPGQGGWRTIYFTILLTHTVLAAAVPPLAIVTLWRGLKGHHPAHRKLARWTLPIWLYVSVTGVVVYWMLYRVNW